MRYSLRLLAPIIPLLLSSTLSAPAAAEYLGNPQKIVLVNITGNYESNIATLYAGMQNLVGPLDTVDFYGISSLEALPADALTGADQVWVTDLSSGTDISATHLAAYTAIASWYDDSRHEIIADSRFQGSLWLSSQGNTLYGNLGRPNLQLFENYFVNLRTRGGGIVLLTDHATAFTRGINSVNAAIGINDFTSFWYSPPYTATADATSSLIGFPVDASIDLLADGGSYLYADSSVSSVPYNTQPGGQILYPLAWVGTDTSFPVISTTIRGTTGLTASVVEADTNDIVITYANDGVVLTASATGENITAYAWSDIDGNSLGTQATVTLPSLSDGETIIRLQLTGDSGMVAEAWVSVYSGFCDGLSQCPDSFSYCVDGACCDAACGGGDAADCQACGIAAGAEADGTCGPSTGNLCDDSSMCTNDDVCDAGTCVGTDVVCEASDQCHGVGSCDTGTGLCADPALADDTQCDDGLNCTAGDSCQSGACEGLEIQCAASDQCHGVGDCDVGTGLCSDPVLADDTQCDDGLSCTTGDSCQLGMCEGAQIPCDTSDACWLGGVCEESTGACPDLPADDGTSCDGGSCIAGTCTAPEPDPSDSPSGTPSSGCGCQTASGALIWQPMMLLVWAGRRRFARRRRA